MSLRSKILAHSEGGKMFWFLVSLIVLVAICYIYSVNRTVVLVAERNEIESKISELRTEITKLESAYISERGNITLDLASALGYDQVLNTVYIPKKSVGVLSQAQSFQ